MLAQFPQGVLPSLGPLRNEIEPTSVGHSVCYVTDVKMCPSRLLIRPIKPKNFKKKLFEEADSDVKCKKFIFEIPQLTPHIDVSG